MIDVVRSGLLFAVDATNQLSRTTDHAPSLESHGGLKEIPHGSLPPKMQRCCNLETACLGVTQG
jgi:hypothetical protein